MTYTNHWESTFYPPPFQTRQIDSSALNTKGFYY